jgi:hypothetical protein
VSEAGGVDSLCGSDFQVQGGFLPTPCPSPPPVNAGENTGLNVQVCSLMPECLLVSLCQGRSLSFLKD